MASSVKNESLQRRAPSKWGHFTSSMSSSAEYVHSKWRWIAGGALAVATVALVGPATIASSVVNAAAAAFNRNNYVVVKENNRAKKVGRDAARINAAAARQMCRTVENMADQATKLADQTRGSLETGMSQCLKTAEVAIAAALCFFGSLAIAKSECSETDTLCRCIRPIAAVVGIIGATYLIAKNILTCKRRKDVSGDPFSKTKVNGERPGPIVLAGEPKPLMKAALEGNVALIQQLQRRGVNLEDRDAEGRTALHHAAAGGQQEAFEWLWYYGCNMNTVDLKDKLPIYYIPDTCKPFREQAEKLKSIKNRFEFKQPIYFFYPPETLVFKGGGPKGIAYVGIQKYLESTNLLRNVTRVAGTSAGAINAVLVALGYNALEMKKVLEQTNLIDFLDHLFREETELMRRLHNHIEKGRSATLEDTANTIESAFKWWFYQGKKRSPAELAKKTFDSGGLCKGETFLDWIEDLIATKVATVCKGKKGDYKHLTFAELRKLIDEGRPFKHIYVYATKIDKNMGIVSINSEASEDKKWDDVIIADAVRASMSIPIAFVPYTLRKKDPDGQISQAPELGQFMDGGMIMNLPIGEFDFDRYRSTNSSSNEGRTNYQTLGFNLVDPPASEPNPASNKKRKQNMVGSVVAVGKVYESAEDMLRRRDPNFASRIIDIDNCGVDLVTGFAATPEVKDRLRESGFAAGKAWGLKQQELAQRYADCDPHKILTIFPPSTPARHQSEEDEKGFDPSIATRQKEVFDRTDALQSENRGNIKKLLSMD